jgi:CubicO group peptidase (beta-lactamase class C family)
MNIKKQLLVFFLLLAFVKFLQAEEISQDRLQQFREFASQQMKQDKVPGMTIGFVRWGKGEEARWIEGFGFADLENQLPAKSESAYRLGSVSKPLTAVAVLKLAQEGKLNLDAEVQTYVPYFPKKKWPVTTRELLAHLGGISHYKDYQVEGRIKEHKNTKESIAIFQDFDLIAEPGTKYSYSSYGYNLLAAVVESASGIPFSEYMKKNVWDPSGMTNTRIDDPTDLIPNRVRGYRILDGEIKNSEFVDISSRLGGGGTRSTVPDLLNFAKSLAEGKLLSEKSMQLIYVSQATKDGRYVDYSAGWGTRPNNGHFMLRHSGSQQETSTVLMCFPGMKLAIACAVNQEDASASAFANRLYEVLTNERIGLDAYVKDQRDTYRVINSIYASGLSYFELYGKPASSDRNEVQKAFDYFKRSIGKDGAKLVDDGDDPITGEPYKIVGSYMAAHLSEKNGSDFEMYHSSGAIPFFSDYVSTCKGESYACDFPKTFTQVVKQWNDSWKKTDSEEIRWMRITADSDLNKVETVIEEKFQNASVYPDLSRGLSDVTWDYLLKGDNAKSLKAGEIGLKFYPESARHLAIYGVALAANSQKANAVSLIKKAYRIDPESPAEPDWISDFAEELANAGKIPEAIRVMETAVEVYPTHAQTLSDMGEAYLAVEDKTKAQEYFQRALKIDPNLARAKKMLDQLKP